MTPLDWPCPQPGGGVAPELALTCGEAGARQVLILPALFDEANRMRRFTAEVMRRLDGAGIGSVLPDLPGCNESLTPLAACDLGDWRAAAGAAAAHFGASHVLAIRGGGLLLPLGLPGWHYGPVKGAALLRQLLRARVLSAREAGREERVDALLEAGLAQGLELAGHRFGAALLRDLQAAEPVADDGIAVIEQDLLGPGALWLRAEPGESRAQADALAAVIAVALAA